MSEEIREFVGHHGTTSANARLIRTNGFRMSPSGWLGKGVYFFQNNSELARAWASKQHGNQRIEVITKSIKVNNEKVFDMVETEGEHNTLFHKKRLEILNQAKRKGIFVNFDRSQLEKQIRCIETKILNEICEKGKFDIVRAATLTKLISIDEWSVTANGTEICVKDFSYIDINMG